MKLRKGDMWKYQADCVIITANATLRTDGCLVMGRGAAYQAWQKFPGCNKVFGRLIKRHLDDCAASHLTGVPYGVIMHPNQVNPMLGILQVKWHYSKPAELDLIEYSVGRLAEVATSIRFRSKLIFLNFPGIGNGGLKRTDVLPLIEILPHNVNVWELPE